MAVLETVNEFFTKKLRTPPPFEPSTFETCTIFLMGVSILQPVFITLAGTGFAMRRFGLPPETIGLFLGFTFCLQDLFCLLGNAATTALTQVFSKPPHEKYWEYIRGTYAMTLCCFTSIWNIRLLLVFGTGIGDAHITQYYWTLASTGFLYGALDGCIRQISPKKIAFMNLGMAFSGMSANVVHFLVAKCLPAGAELSYWSVYWQLLYAIILSMVAGIMFTIVVIFDRFGPPKPDYSSGGSFPDVVEALQTGLPFITMICLGWGLTFGVYPNVAPFSLVGFMDAQLALRLIMCMQAVIGIAVVLLNEKCNLWKSWNQQPHYYASMLLFIPYFGCAICFFIAMHYPESAIGSKIYMNKKLVCFMTCLFVGCAYVLMSMGWSGFFMTMEGTKDTTPGGRLVVMAATGLGFMVILVLTKYLGQGYLRAFREAKSGLESGLPWPTHGKNGAAAFFYWVGKGFSGGFRTLLSNFTTDIRTKILV
ncbi:uncharacterized protein BXIN_2331 [Babesia sp. Xinjiang]|uniref:uncharacterized protein n=1 Tax=Babesia sp. Xinjiang TaxID=462227 RepID=UPI000A252A26|nr:uncharacterized protein BXIN_2331 [Babesia sp. Xinjiang]ORM40787.1 hypothetical protein BXIN_2331 [Babesia sp. Xinjiang]